jgi:uncharacterized membrane protein YfcA
MHLDWHVIAPFTIAALVGAIIGKRVADKLSGDALTTSFAVMLVARRTLRRHPEPHRPLSRVTGSQSPR